MLLGDHVLYKNACMSGQQTPAACLARAAALAAALQDRRLLSCAARRAACAPALGSQQPTICSAPLPALGVQVPSVWAVGDVTDRMALTPGQRRPRLRLLPPCSFSWGPAWHVRPTPGAAPPACHPRPALQLDVVAAGNVRA